MLVSIVFASVATSNQALKEIENRVMEGKYDSEEIASWIDLLTSFGSGVFDSQGKSLFHMLYKSKYKFLSGDLEKFLVCFGSGHGWYAEDIAELYLDHPDTTNDSVLDVISKIPPRNRNKFFKMCFEKRDFNLLDCIKCLKYPEISRMAVTMVKTHHEIVPSDREEAKKLLLEALLSSGITEDIFVFLLKWELLSVEELIEMSKKVGTKKLAKRALKNNLQFREED
ncbi:MAG: hypothetical protein PHW24_02930 [Candidatus Moranbacteria bacterium]|nr:hypothetical protein [Candidatus Moranbacteria bacterium]